MTGLVDEAFSATLLAKVDMSYIHLSYIHFFTVLPAIILGTYLMLQRKGTATHKLLGKIFLSIILFTSITTLFMAAKVGPRLFNHFGLIHLLSLNIIYGSIVAYRAAQKGDIKTHRANMIGMYFFGFIVAGSFALMPSRLLHHWLFE